MELARHTMRRSILIYKNNLHQPLRRSGNVTNIAPAACRSRDTDSAKTSSFNEGINKINKIIKDDVIENAIGATDELTSFIGLAREFAGDNEVAHPYVDKLKRVQMILFDLNHAISRSRSNKPSQFQIEHTRDLEEWILEYANQLPPPEDFIIPGGGKACASLHVARTICKRAERNVMPLVREGVLDEQTQIYLNRLSEFLLTVSRIAAKCDQRTENIYIPRAEIPDEK